MLSRCKSILFLFLLLNLVIFADEGEEKLFSIEDDTYHSTELSETLDKIKKHPYNINKVSGSNLEKLPWLSENDIDLILQYRKDKKINNFSKLTEIGINEITISELKPYLVFSSEKQFKITQISRAEFQEKNKELPSSLKYYQKTLLNFKHLNFGFVSQKDEGEKDLLDFYSYFIEYNGNNFLKKAIVGKYRLALGQGVLFAPKLGMSKSAEATSIPVKKYKPIKAYTSSYEIWELEGATAQLKFGNFDLIPFYSSTFLSANIDSTTSKITSFNLSGLHYDEEEKDNVREDIFGTALNFNFKRNRIGINFSRHKFSEDFKDPETENDYSAIGANFYLLKNKYPCFGEIAFIEDKIAGVVGTKWGEDKIRQLLLFRYYDKNFPTFHGKAFSAQSANFDNEIGLYYGITLLPFKKTKLNIYFDVWKFPETRYFEKMPTVGSEQFIQLEIQTKKNGFRFTLQHKDKEKNKTLDDVSKIRDFERTLFRFDWWQQVFPILRIKTRCELITEYFPVEEVFSKGILAYEQLKLKTGNLELITQLAIYRSDTEPAKVLLYMYENNVDGIMQNSIFSGDGIYSYLLLKYQVLRSSEIQFKIADSWNSADKMKYYLQVVSRF